MRFTAAAALTMAGVAAAAHVAPSNGTMGDAYTTEVVTAFTTYCPEATQITHGGQTYTVSQATTLTITNCPGGCTVTKPVSSAAPPAPPATTPAAPVYTSAMKSTPVAPVPYTTSAVVVPPPVYPTNNGTAPAPVPAPSGTGSYTSATEGSPIPAQTGAASTLSAGAAGILAVFGLVAAL